MPSDARSVRGDPRAPGRFCREEETMDDQGGSRGRHAADPDGPNDAESAADDVVTPPEGSPSSPSEGSLSSPRGRVRSQDPATTTPRPPSVAEQRARREAQKRERAQAEAAQAAAERKRTIRKRVLIGGGVAVGLVAVVAIVYAASGPDEVEAQCTDQNGVVVDDDECNRPATGGYYNSSGAFVPIFIGGGGSRYQYNYGSRVPRGSVVSGGSTSPPSSGTSVRSGTSGSRIGSSDSSGTVSRGGLGVGGSSSSSSGSSGSSSSGS